MVRRPRATTFFPYTTLFRSNSFLSTCAPIPAHNGFHDHGRCDSRSGASVHRRPGPIRPRLLEDRKSTRLNSSHLGISYAVFCLKKKKGNARTLMAEIFPRAR